MAVLNDPYDVIVVGGGPAGSTVATLVAQQGHSVLLLDKSDFPRYQIGESLLPSTINGICVLLGVDRAIHDAGFTRKLGGAFRWGRNPDPWTFSFGVMDKKRKNPAFAYQVERSKFDDILLQNARSKNVQVETGHAVTKLVSGEGRVSGVEFRDKEGRTRSVRSRFVVDASGHSSVISKAVGERVYSKFFRNYALFGYYEGGKRLPAPSEGNILSAAFDEGWFWYIPLSSSMTSVGAVFHAPEDGSKPKALEGNLEAAMERFIARCPVIADFLRDASRIKEGQYGELRVRRDWSYANTKYWREGLVLVGDAACFVDPLLSQGVHLATYSGLLAARSINSCLAGRVDEKEAFEEFEFRYRREYELFYQYLTYLYDMNQDQDSFFWAARSLLKTEERGNEAFIRLLAGQASADSAIALAQDYFDARQGSGEALGEALNEDFDPSDSILGDAQTASVKKLLPAMAHEAGQVQLLARFGKNRPQEVPLREGGLIASEDGLHWDRSVDVDHGHA